MPPKTDAGKKKAKQNLVPSWIKGQSGNANGRPKGTPTSKTLLSHWLAVKEDYVIPETGEVIQLSQFDIMTIAQIEKAKRGSFLHYIAILDRLEGRPMQEQKIEHISTLVARIVPQSEIDARKRAAENIENLSDADPNINPDDFIDVEEIK